MANKFPAVTLMSSQGRRLALAAGVVFALVVVALFWASMLAPVGLALGLVAAVAVWAGVRLVAELVEVVAETLLPR
jgi:hypothetical protein